MEKVKFETALAVNLGAVNTGLYMISHKVGDTPTASDAVGVNFLTPGSANIVFSQADRTAMRHHRRCIQRKQMARRLLHSCMLAVFAEKKVSLADKQLRELRGAMTGLLKRRGYSRVERENDLSVLESVDPAVFASFPVLGEYFNKTDSIADQWEAMSNRIEDCIKFSEEVIDRKAYKGFLKENFPDLEKSEITACSEAVGAIRQECISLEQMTRSGARHRSEYLESLKAEIHQDTRLKPLVDALGGEDVLYRLVGNVSNLQLRANRWYFNDPVFAKEIPLKQERLKKTLIRAYKFFHPKDEDRARIQSVIAAFESCKTGLEALCSVDPVLTIPVYEDQNQRNPPVDQTLLLNPKKLQNDYGDDWRLWATSMLSADPALGEGLDEILKLADRTSRRAICDNRDTTEYRLSYILQRGLDRSSKEDIYALRAVCNDMKGQAATKGRDNIKRIFGRKGDAFIEFAKRYYDEVNEAKVGLWFLVEDPILERSNLHPKAKNKVTDLLAGNLMCGNAEDGKRLIAVWKETISGQSTMLSLCRGIEATVKAYGRSFDYLYTSAQHKKAEIDAADRKEMDAVAKKVRQIKTFLLENGFTDTEVSRLCNPYSLSALFSILETERSGFCKNSTAVMLENTWRTADETGGSGAHCTRLAADTVRPFDGLLARWLDRIAYEIAQVYDRELRTKNIKNSSVRLNLLLQENRFDFDASLGELKSIPAKKLADKRKKAALPYKEWQSKKDRIKEASRGICPYTGKPIEDNGVMDYILTPSKTKRERDEVFNSEANLIWVSEEGDRIKGDKVYGLSDLHPKYLEAVFGSASVPKIEKVIEDRIADLVNSDKLKSYSSLSDNDKICFRHALFLPQANYARRQVEDVLRTSVRTMINGTQAYFTQILCKKILEITKDWRQRFHNRIEFDVNRIDAYDTFLVRDALSDADPNLAKGGANLASRIADALACYGYACGVRRISRKMDADAALANFKKAQNLVALFPRSMINTKIMSKSSLEKDKPQTKKPFKDSVLAAEYLPIYIYRDLVSVGFRSLPRNAKENTDNASADASLIVGGKNPKKLLELLNPVLEVRYNPDREYCKPTTFRVDKRKAHDWFRNEEKRKGTEYEKTAELLRNLRYNTLRTSVEGRLYDAMAKKMNKAEDILSSRAMELKVKFGKKTEDFMVNGVVRMPFAAKWEEIVFHPDIKPLLGGELPEDFNLALWLKKHRFGDRLESDMTVKNGRPRGRTRVTVSLPVVNNGLSTLSLKRKNYFGEPLVQEIVVEGTKFAGFAADKDGKTDFATLVLAPQYTSKNIVDPSGKTVSLKDTPNYVSVFDWKTIYQDDEFTVEMRPATAGRPRLRVEMPFERFSELAQTENTQSPERVRPSEFISKAAMDMFVSRYPQLDGILAAGKTEKDYDMKVVGERVVFEYIASSFPASLKKAYNEAL